jgi:hypothetical protein
MHVRQPNCLVLNLDPCQKVRILVAVLNAVPYLLAAETPLVSQLLELFFLLISRILILFILYRVGHFMLHELAARLLFTSLATAPPHFAAPL